MSDITTVGVLGAGTMGNGIAHVFARSGFNVRLCEVQQSFLDRGLDSIRKNLAREVSKSKIKFPAPRLVFRLKNSPPLAPDPFPAINSPATICTLVMVNNTVPGLTSWKMASTHGADPPGLGSVGKAVSNWNKIPDAVALPGPANTASPRPVKTMADHIL